MLRAKTDYTKVCSSDTCAGSLWVLWLQWRDSLRSVLIRLLQDWEARKVWRNQAGPGWYPRTGLWLLKRHYKDRIKRTMSLLFQQQCVLKQQLCCHQQTDWNHSGFTAAPGSGVYSLLAAMLVPLFLFSVEITVGQYSELHIEHWQQMTQEKMWTAEICSAYHVFQATENKT